MVRIESLIKSEAWTQATEKYGYLPEELMAAEEVGANTIVRKTMLDAEAPLNQQRARALLHEHLRAEAAVKEGIKTVAREEKKQKKQQAKSSSAASNSSSSSSSSSARGAAATAAAGPGDREKRGGGRPRTSRPAADKKDQCAFKNCDDRKRDGSWVGCSHPACMRWFHSDHFDPACGAVAFLCPAYGKSD